MLILSQHCYSQIDSLSYKVYSAYLASFYHSYYNTTDSRKSLSQDTTQKIILFEKTGSLPSWVKRDTTRKIQDNTLKKMYPGLLDETLVDFMSKIDDRKVIDNKFTDIFMPLIIADDRIYQTIHSDDKNSYLYEELRKGRGAILKLSNVGFNKRKNQAIIYVESYVDEFAASGNFIILEEEDGNWKVIRTLHLWKS